VIEDLPLPLLNSLFSKISEVPTSQFSEMHLEFLKEFTQKAIEATYNEDNDSVTALREYEVLQNFNKALTSPETFFESTENHFGLPIFWNMLKDSTKMGSDFAESEALKMGIDSMCEILVSPYARFARAYYLVQAFKNL